MQAARKFLVGGNWKCNNTFAKTQDLIKNVVNKCVFDPSKVQVVIAPVFLHLGEALKTANKDVIVCSQNCSLTGFGAFTGELSCEQLKDFGINWTLTGHSERRAMFGESNEIVAKKTKRAVDYGLEVIACIGEQLEAREAGKTFDVVQEQLTAINNALEIADWNHVSIAYEPVWAIGTGLSASPAQAQEVHDQIRKWLAEKVNAEVAGKTRIIYGGSVSDANCGELINEVDIDGFLIGGAALKDQFVTIVDTVNKK